MLIKTDRDTGAADIMQPVTSELALDSAGVTVGNVRFHSNDLKRLEETWSMTFCLIVPESKLFQWGWFCL